MTEEQYHDLNCHGNKLLITAVLDFIEAEMKRLYYNKYQKEMKSPYMNTDEDYSNSFFLFTPTNGEKTPSQISNIRI